jgi:hypothetical protein
MLEGYKRPLAIMVVALLGVAAVERAGTLRDSASRAVIRASLEGTGNAWAYLEVSGGRAYLRGSAPSDSAADSALTVARNATCSTWLGTRPCVRTVAGEFDVAGVAWPALSASIHREVLTLTGRVPDEAMRWAIVDRARVAAARGRVRSVDDRLTLMNLGAPAGVDATASRVAAMAALCEAGEVTLLTGVVSLTCLVSGELHGELLELAGAPLMAGYLGEVDITVSDDPAILTP